VALGGSLATEIQEIDGRMDHRAPQSDDQDERFAIRHPVRIAEGSCLAGIFGAGEIMVNSVHRQGIGEARAAPRRRGGRRGRNGRSRLVIGRAGLCGRRAVASRILGRRATMIRPASSAPSAMPCAPMPTGTGCAPQNSVR
jgi:hypothetical protein